MLKVAKRIQRELLFLPESGMGYQIVKAKFRDYSVRDMIVFNATLALSMEGENWERALYGKDLNYLMQDLPEKDNIIEIKISTGEKVRPNFSGMVLEERSRAWGKGADKAPVELTTHGELFVRFSHFKNDLRIDSIRKCVLPGTYATTNEDAKYCLAEEINPIARYALPNNLEIKYAFCIIPSRGTPIQKGIVEPANGQPGGGVEVIFVKGTQEKTVSPAVSIDTPDEICKENINQSKKLG